MQYILNLYIYLFNSFFLVIIYFLFVKRCLFCRKSNVYIVLTLFIIMCVYHLVINHTKQSCRCFISTRDSYLCFNKMKNEKTLARYKELMDLCYILFLMFTSDIIVLPHRHHYTSFCIDHS